MADCGPCASRAVRCGGGGPARRARCGPGAVVPAGRHFAGSVGPPVRVTLRHGERLRLRLWLRLRRRGWRWGEAGPGAHHGAGEGADRRGQRAGALAAHDRQVLSEVHREARRRAGQLGAEVHRHVHGPVYGRLERGFQSLQLSAAAGESQHVKRRGLLDEGGTVRGRDERPVRLAGGKVLPPFQPLPWQSNKPSLNLLHPLAFISTGPRSE